MLRSSSLASFTNKALALANVILVSPRTTKGYQPKNSSSEKRQEPPPLLFHYEGEQSFEFESEITDHYVEDNTSRQDNISLRPEVVTVHGCIGELNNIPPDYLLPLQLAADKLVPISGYAPQLSQTALVAYNTALRLWRTGEQVVDAAVEAWASIKDRRLPGSDDGMNVIDSTGIEGFDASSGSVSRAQNDQQVRFQQFYGYMRQRTLFRVQTPWCIIDDMAIQSLRAVQSENTNLITDFYITFKKMRMATTQREDVDASMQGRLKSMVSGLTNIGPNQAVDAGSIASRL